MFKVRGKIIWRLVSFVLGVHCAFSQEGSLANRASTPISQTNSPSVKIDTKLKVGVPIEKYKLVVAASAEPESQNQERGEVDYHRLRQLQIDRFVAELNKVGELGYKLVSVVEGWYPIAIAELDEAQFEYAWFETNSHLDFIRLSFEEKYSDLGKRGFRVVQQIRTQRLCETITDIEGLNTGEKCEIIDLFLLERVRGKSKANRQVYFNIPSIRWPGSKASVDLTNIIKNGFAKKMLPVNLFSQFEVLLEESHGIDHNWAADSDIQIVRSPDGRKQLKKRVNALAKQGYRMAMTNNGVALMYRDRETAEPLSYVWLDTSRRTMMWKRKGVRFESELTVLQQNGAVYRMTYPNKLGDKGTLVFEQASTGKKEPREYKILELGDPTYSSNEKTTMINRLAKEGFVVRDLFVSEKLCVILERIK